MSERIERRKDIFKSVHSSSNINSSTKKCNEYTKKGLEKRSHLILAKRFKPSCDNSIDSLMIDSSINSAIENSDQYLHEIIMKSKSTDKATQYEGLKIMRKILGSETPHIGIFAESGVILLLSKLLMNTNDNIRIEAAWCLTNIATGNHAETGLVLPAIPSMIMILSSDNYDKDSIALKEQICWTIGNIAGDCDEYRTILHANGCLMVILKFLESSFKAIQSQLQKSSSQSPCFISSTTNSISSTITQSAIQTAAWTISNLARGSISGSLFVNTGKLPYLVDLMSITIFPLSLSSHMISSALLAASEEIWWLFAFLTAKEDTEVVDYLISLNLCGSISNILDQFVQQCIDTMVAIDTISIIPLIRCLGNITSGPVVWLTNIVGDLNILKALLFFTDFHTLQHNPITTATATSISDSSIHLPQEEDVRGGGRDIGITNNTTSANTNITSSSASVYTQQLSATHRAIMKETLWVVSNLLGSVHSRNTILECNYSPVSTTTMTTNHMEQQQQQSNSNILSNIIDALLYDDFNIQQEAIFCLEQACLAPTTLTNIITHTEQFTLPSILFSFDSLLRIPGSSIEISIAIIKIINALATHSPVYISNQCVDVGITETLENLQYNCNNQELSELADALVNKFYKYLEAEDIMDNNNMINQTIIDNNSNNNTITNNMNNSIDFNYSQNVTNIYNFGIDHNNTNFNNNSISPSSGSRGRGIHLLQPSWMDNNNVL